MKVKRLFSVIGLGLFAFAAVGAGLIGAKAKKAEPVKAETTSVTLAGSFNDWNTTADPLTLNGDFWTIEKTLSENDEFKVVVNGSDWVGDGDGVSWCDGMGSVGKGQNFKVLADGTYRVKAVATIGDYGDKSYGISFEKVVPQYTVTKYEVLAGVLGEKIGEESVNEGTLYNPAKVFKSHYSFDAWYTDEECQNPYTSASISADLTLYAYFNEAHDSGTLTVELGALGCTWSEAAANYAIYFYDESYSPTLEGWSSYVTGTSDGQVFVDISYSLDFQPANMIVARYSPSYTEEAWLLDPWALSSPEYKWGQTENLSFHVYDSVIRVGAYESEFKNNNASTGVPEIASYDGEYYYNIQSLNNHKKNGAGHPELYDSCYLEAGTKFKVEYSPYGSEHRVSAYSTHSSIESRFSLDGDGNIVCSESDTYVFYFDDYSLTLYITTRAQADADEWAQEFLSINCDATKAQWSTMKARFNALSADAKALFVNEIHVEHDAEIDGYIKKAVQRYDYIIELYGIEGEGSFEDFMGRVEAQGIVPASLGSLQFKANTFDSTSIIIIVSVAVVSVSSLSLLLVVKRRKQN